MEKRVITLNYTTDQTGKPKLDVQPKVTQAFASDTLDFHQIGSPGTMRNG